jgi:hypothetical protein
VKSRTTPLAERELLSWTKAAGSIPAWRATCESKVRLKNSRGSKVRLRREDDHPRYRHSGRFPSILLEFIASVRPRIQAVSG